MTHLIPLSSISISNLEKCYVNDALDNNMLSSSGTYVKKFENLIAYRTNTNYAIATSSGTSSLELLLRAMDIGFNDEVIVPAFTFASPALAVASLGAKPIFVDISQETWTIDPSEVMKKINKRTKAIIAVDILGHPCDYDELKKFGLPIIEDAAEAHGATYKSIPVGSLGNAAIFSFHANKVISCGEGGSVVTNDINLNQKIRNLNSFGMDPQRNYWHIQCGSNRKMSNLVAAFGVGQLERWAELIAGRKEVAKQYDDAFKSLPIQRRPVAEWAEESVWLYTLASEKRQSILEACIKNGIDARAVWPLLPENPIFNCDSNGYPIAKKISSTAIWLPTWSFMPQDYIEQIISVIKNVFK